MGSSVSTLFLFGVSCGFADLFMRDVSLGGSHNLAEFVNKLDDMTCEEGGERTWARE